MGQSPDRSNGGRSTNRAVNFALIAVILSGAGYLLTPTREEDPPAEVAATLADPPEPVFAPNETGVLVGRLDVDALRVWCASAGLPPPPAVVSAEAAVARTLTDALRDAARRPSAASFGTMGMISEHLESHETAVAHFRRAATADAADFRWPYYLGCIYQVTGHTDEAFAAFEKVLDLNDAYPLTHARLGQLDLEAGRDEAAAARFARYVELQPRDSLGHVGLGRVAIRRGDFAGALRHLQEAVQWGANDFQCHYNLGRAYAGLGEEELSKRHFDICAKLPKGAWFHFRDPLDQALHASSGSVTSVIQEFERLKDSKDWPKLAALAERILEQRPDDTALLRNLALVYAKLGRFADADERIRRAVHRQPKDASLRLVRAQVLFLGKDYPNALSAADESLRLNESVPAAHSLRSRSLFVLGRKDEALTAMRRALALEPDSLQNTYLLAEMLLGTAQPDEAAVYYRKVLEIAPAHTGALAKLEQIGS